MLFRSPYADRVPVAHSLEEALEVAASLEGDVMIAGGGQVYEQALPVARSKRRCCLPFASCST